MSGGTTSWHHGLAALYIGISVAYGHRMITWADAKFAARFRGAAPRPRLFGSAYTIACWKDVARTMLAAAIAAGLLGGLIALVGDAARTAELLGFSDARSRRRTPFAASASTASDSPSRPDCAP